MSVGGFGIYVGGGEHRFLKAAKRLEKCSGEGNTILSAMYNMQILCVYVCIVELCIISFSEK